MKKHFFYITKSLMLISLLSLIVLSEYGLPFENKKGSGFINFGKLWDARASMPGADPIVLDNHPGNTAILMVHDYSGTPSNVRDMAVYLNKMKYNVFVPLLPGHGTDMNDFQKTRFGNFTTYVKEAFLSLKKKYKKIIGIGISTGGSLLMKLLIEQKISLDALVLINSPVMLLGYTRGKYTLPDFRLLFSGILRYFTKKVKTVSMTPEQRKVAPWQGYDGWMILDHIHFLKIRLRKIKKHCFRITSPLLIISSKINPAVPPENAMYIFNHAQSKIKELKWIDIPQDDPLKGQHLTIHTGLKEKVFDIISGFLKYLPAR